MVVDFGTREFNQALLRGKVRNMRTALEIKWLKTNDWTYLSRDLTNLWDLYNEHILPAKRRKSREVVSRHSAVVLLDKL